MAELNLKPGEEILLHGEMSLHGRIWLAVPEVWPGDAYLTTQRLVHFRRELSSVPGQAHAPWPGLSLVKETRLDLEVALEDIQRLGRSKAFGITPVFTLETNNGQRYTLSPKTPDQSVETWLKALQETLRNQHTRRLSEGPAGKWTIHQA